MKPKEKLYIVLVENPFDSANKLTKTWAVILPSNTGIITRSCGSAGNFTSSVRYERIREYEQKDLWRWRLDVSKILKIPFGGLGGPPFKLEFGKDVNQVFFEHWPLIPSRWCELLTPPKDGDIVAQVVHSEKVKYNEEEEEEY